MAQIWACGVILSPPICRFVAFKNLFESKVGSYLRVAMLLFAQMRACGTMINGLRAGARPWRDTARQGRGSFNYQSFPASYELARRAGSAHWRHRPSCPYVLDLGGLPYPATWTRLHNCWSMTGCLRLWPAVQHHSHLRRGPRQIGKIDQPSQHQRLLKK
jgi:hypothetical protein